MIGPPDFERAKRLYVPAIVAWVVGIATLFGIAYATAPHLPPMELWVPDA